MSECADLTYYQRNQSIILNRAKYYYENDKERLRKHARDKYRNLSEEEKNKKKKNMDTTYTAICLKKRNKDLKNIKKSILRSKSLNIITNKIVFYYDLIVHAVDFSYSHSNK